jgi:hypothetical protein
MRELDRNTQLVRRTETTETEHLMFEQLAHIRKAIVAAAVPGITVLIADVSAELQTQAVAIIAVVATGLLTYLVPNRT